MLLTPEDKKRIVYLKKKENLSNEVLAKRFGVTRRSILDVLKGYIKFKYKRIGEGS